MRNSGFAVLPTQRDAWFAQIEFLKKQLQKLEGSLHLEFNVPRMGRRIDAVILTGPALFVIEFKVGDAEFDRAAIDQVWDYALDLKNFHESSHAAAIVPILVATEVADAPLPVLTPDPDQVYRPVLANPKNFREVLALALKTVVGESLDSARWSSGSYRPTPTIIEAARALYAQHSVEAIDRYDAGAENLRVTSRRVEELIDEASTRSGR